MPKFKDYDQGLQKTLFPLDLDSLVPTHHLARQIDAVISRVDVAKVSVPFSDKGSSSYHPLMMLKVIIYGYATKNYSCRGIAAMLRQDVTYMWLSGMQTPDFNTINRFRSKYLKYVIEEVFNEVLFFLEEHQYISFENYFVDGTKLEADARKHSQVWRKNTERYKAGVQKRIESLMEEIDDLNTNEDKIYNKKDLPELGEQSNISSEQVKKVADSIDKKLADKQKEKTISKKKARQVKSKIKKLTQEKDKLQNYEKQEENLGERNSYSKTDVDATMMRMKGSDELRPGYNVQVSSENQFAVEVSVGQNASDSVCFPEHLRRSQERGENFVPSNYVGDAGYGSEENYELLEQEKIGNHLMFPTFSYEQTEKHKNNIFHRDNMPYNRELDCFVCPNSVNLSFKETIIKTNKNGFKQEVRVYQSEGCDGCQFKEKCTKAKGNRTIQVNEKLERHKDITRENLNSPQGKIFRKMRGFEIETFFGDLKHNQKYRRIRLRGLSNALLEMSWLAISYNLRKLNIAVIEELA